MGKSLFNKLKNNLQKFKTSNSHLTRDEIRLNLWGLNLLVKRETTSEVPSELSVIVPRVEYDEKKVIINSITVVIAPRHPLAEAEASSPPPLQLPKTGLSFNFKQNRH
jgi:hypothetical protein